MLKAIKTTNGWILCGACGHKLAREIVEPLVKYEKDEGFVIQFKCASCKALNEYDGSDK